MLPWYLCWFTLSRDCLGHTLCFLYLTKYGLVICSICIKIISYNFLDLVHKVLVRTGNISDMRHSEVFFFKLPQPALQKIKNIHTIPSNCAFTKTEAVLIDVYVFNLSPFSSSFFKCAFLLLKSVVWYRQTKNICERHQNQNSSLVKRQNDNTSPGDWPRKISP